MVTKLGMILVIIKHLKSYLETFTTNMPIDETERKQDKFDGSLGALRAYSASGQNMLKQRISS